MALTFERTHTQAGYGDGAAGLWVMLFTVSKVFELVDTVILVFKGKDPMFLHWCVLLRCVRQSVDRGAGLALALKIENK